MKYQYILFLFPFLLANRCDPIEDNTQGCPLTDLVTNQEMVEHVKKTYNIPDHAIKVNDDKEHSAFIQYDFQGQIYEINKESRTESKSDYEAPVNKQLTIFRDDACDELTQIELDESLDYQEKRRQRRLVKNRYMDSCMSVIRANSEKKAEGEDKGPLGEESKQCHPNLKKVMQNSRLILTLPWLPSGHTVVLHFEPLRPLEAFLKSDNYGLPRTFQLDSSSSLDIKRSDLTEGFEDIDLIVSVFSSKEGTEEENICSFEWMH